MPTAEDVLVNNFKETVTRHDRWVVAAILGSVFVLLVTIGEFRARAAGGSPGGRTISLPFGLPATEPGAAVTLALTLTVAAGPAIVFYWLRMRKIAVGLTQKSPDLFAAAMTFPSLMTVDYTLVKAIVLMIPPALMFMSLKIEGETLSGFAIAGAAVLFSPWIIAVGLAMRPLPKAS